MSIKFIVQLVYYNIYNTYIIHTYVHKAVSNFTLGVALTSNLHAEHNLTIRYLDRSCKILCISIKQRKKFIFRILAAGLCAPYSLYLEHRQYSYNCPHQASFVLLLVKLTTLMFSECCSARINVFSSGTLIISRFLNT